MTLTSRRRVLGLQSAGLGWRAQGTEGLSSESCVSWHKGRSKTGKNKREDIKGTSSHLVLRELVKIKVAEAKIV